MNILFLDRDGVLNRRLPGAYVSAWAQWEWLPGTLEALAILNRSFDRIFIITNQQGIGKGVMTTAQLTAIHKFMLFDIQKHGGQIDAIYFCPNLAADDSPCRKPKPGMIEQAKKDFPEIIGANYSLVGDSFSDLKLGIDQQMATYWIDTKEEDRSKILSQDWPLAGRFESLLAWCNHAKM